MKIIILGAKTAAKNHPKSIQKQAMNKNREQYQTTQLFMWKAMTFFANTFVFDDLQCRAHE